MSPFDFDEEMDGLETRMEETSRMAASFSSTLASVRDSSARPPATWATSRPASRAASAPPSTGW